MSYTVTSECGVSGLISIVMAEFLFATGGYTPTNWQLKGLATGCITFIILCKLLWL